MSKTKNEPATSGTAHTLTQGALVGLRMLLQDTAWLKDHAAAIMHSYRAGVLLEEVLPALEVPQFKDNKDAVAWENKKADAITFTPKQLETIKLCVEINVKRGALPNGKHKLLLMRLVGLGGDE